MIKKGELTIEDIEAMCDKQKPIWEWEGSEYAYEKNRGDLDLMWYPSHGDEFHLFYEIEDHPHYPGGVLWYMNFIPGQKVDEGPVRDMDHLKELLEIAQS